jgi:lysophospholipid acyltransferase (LPLAT)-like uncharacterized protein
VAIAAPEARIEMTGTTSNRSLTQRALAFTAALLLSQMVRLWGRLSPLRAMSGEEHMIGPFAAGEPVILCWWHNRLAYLTWFVSSRARRHGVDLTALISRSRDGDLMAGVTERLGVSVVRGSTSRGGAVGLRELARRIRRGGSVATVGDGPRGPVYELKPGPVALAKLTGAPIVPIAYAAERAWRLNSWDRFIVPKPLSGISLVFGPPLRVARDASEEEVNSAIRELQQRLNDLVSEAEALLEGSSGGERGE